MTANFEAGLPSFAVQRAHLPLFYYYYFAISQGLYITFSIRTSDRVIVAPGTEQTEGLLFTAPRCSW